MLLLKSTTNDALRLTIPFIFVTTHQQEVLLLTACIAFALAAPQRTEAEAEIVAQDSNIDPDGSYQYRYANISNVLIINTFNWVQ